MKPIHFLALLFLLFFLACDQEPTGSPFLTVDVGYVDTDPANELWVFASDASGQLIDIKKVKRGTNYLESVRVDLSIVDLTIVTVIEGNHNFITYNDISTDRLVKINTWDPIFPTSHQVDLTLTNYNEGSDPYYTLAINGGFGNPGYGTHSFNNGELQVPVAVYANPGKLLVTGYRNGDPVYSLTTGIKTRLIVKLDFNNFEPLKDLITIGGASLGRVVGHSNELVHGGNFLIHNATQDFTIEDPFIQIGYIPGFDYYNTTVQKALPLTGHWTSYTKVGAPVTELTWPNVSIKVLDRTQENFQVDCSMPVDQIKTSSMLLVNSKAVHWTVYGAGNSAGGIRPNIPPMFLARLNASRKEDFQFVNGEIVSSGGTFTHQDLLDEKLYDGTPKREYECFKFYF
jgi:hypothetical protein